MNWKTTKETSMHQPGHSAFRLPFPAFGIAFTAIIGAAAIVRADTALYING